MPTLPASDSKSRISRAPTWRRLSRIGLLSETLLLEPVELAANFGLNGQTLRAVSALLPIAYYLYFRRVPENYVTHGQFVSDRETIRQWLVRSLLKASGIWGSGLDTLLTALRDVIKNGPPGTFPSAALKLEMESRGKSLSFSPAEIDEILSMQYGDKRLFGLLSLIFTFVDLRNRTRILITSFQSHASLRRASNELAFQRLILKTFKRWQTNYPISNFWRVPPTSKSVPQCPRNG